MNSFQSEVESILEAFSGWIWGYPLLFLLVGGGLFLVLHSGLQPFRFFFHAIGILAGKHEDEDTKGKISHFEALSQALASSVGMGNISGVAVAVVMGGPGAIFWMWVSAAVGMITKFYSCSLAIMYRGKDSAGNWQGGPMYVIREALPKWTHWLAVMFSICGLVGVLPIFQANQLTEIVRVVLFIPNGLASEADSFTANALFGLVVMVLVSGVIFGGLERIVSFASKLVPFMVVVYVISVLIILIKNASEVPHYLGLIVTDAFTAQSVLGGAVGQIIITGVRRAAFSNEAGIGTAPMAHGAARTKEPIKEGLVAMMGPAIDTLLVCTMTALVILITGVWKTTDANGVSLTLQAFEDQLGGLGTALLMLSVITFAFSSLFAYSWYGRVCTGFLIGAKRDHWYNYIYAATIFIGAVVSIDTVVYLIDSAFALMAIPTMFSTLWLAPKVRLKAKSYFASLKA